MIRLGHALNLLAVRAFNAASREAAVDPSYRVVRRRLLAGDELCALGLNAVGVFAHPGDGFVILELALRDYVDGVDPRVSQRVVERGVGVAFHMSGDNFRGVAYRGQ
jgi:hypothetical protein